MSITLTFSIYNKHGFKLSNMNPQVSPPGAVLVPVLVDRGYPPTTVPDRGFLEGDQGCTTPDRGFVEDD